MVRDCGHSFDGHVLTREVARHLVCVLGRCSCADRYVPRCPPGQFESHLVTKDEVVTPIIRLDSRDGSPRGPTVICRPLGASGTLVDILKSVCVILARGKRGRQLSWRWLALWLCNPLDH